MSALAKSIDAQLDGVEALVRGFLSAFWMCWGWVVRALWYRLMGARGCHARARVLCVFCGLL